MMIKLSVVIPYYNRADALLKTLLALANQTISPSDYEVIVVDDGSQNNGIENFKNLTLPYSLEIFKQENQGPGAARNLGASHVRSEFIVFLDTDIVPDQNLLMQYLTSHNANSCAVIIGRQLPMDGVYPDDFAEVHRSVLVSDPGDEPKKIPFYSLASGNFGIGRKSFIEMGGFTETLQMVEDIDLGYRADRRGILLLYNPKAVGYHNHPKKLDQIYRYIRLGASWTNYLFDRYPEMRNQIPVYLVDESISWRNDSFMTILNKIFTRFSATPIGLYCLELASSYVPRLSQTKRLRRYFFYKIAAAYRYLGFHERMINS